MPLFQIQYDEASFNAVFTGGDVSSNTTIKFIKTAIGSWMRIDPFQNVFNGDITSNQIPASFRPSKSQVYHVNHNDKKMMLIIDATGFIYLRKEDGSPIPIDNVDNVGCGLEDHYGITASITVPLVLL